MAQADHSKNKIYLNYRYKFIYYTTEAATHSFNFKNPSVHAVGKLPVFILRMAQNIK